MAKALLQLNDYWLVELNLQASHLVDAEAEELPRERDPRVSWETMESEAGNSYLITLSVNDKLANLRLRVVIAGVFSFDGDASEDEMLQMIALNGPSILYGIARGIAGTVTSSTADGRLILPPVNFVELHKKRNAAERATARRASKSA